MNVSQIVGLALVITGLFDVLLALVLLGPRLPEDRRRLVQSALLTGAGVLLAFGAALLSGALHV